ncbi:hypothetical protein ACNF42_06410 [Cuniculiplasma sp. SKW3]|uniref:hypothetical protein n=3 Tax=unclassified Cuniculiplasma TaxID=2619706 RepID=UPI003FCF848B
MISGISRQILEVLKDDELSISGIREKLESRGIKVHRLTLSGYLSSMVDSGFLKYKDIKPAKVYSIDDGKVISIYSMIGNAVSKRYPGRTGDMSLLLLFNLFNRPIFLREVELCSAELPRAYKQSFSKRKEIYIQKLGLLGINITENERLMEPSFEDKTAVLSMMRDLILLSNDIQYIEEISDVEQKTLEDV